MNKNNNIGGYGMNPGEVKAVCDALEISPSENEKGSPVFKKTKPSGKSARSGTEPTFKEGGGNG